MTHSNYRAGIIGLGFIGGADQVSGDALGQLVSDLDGTHAEALSKHPRIDLIAGSSRDDGRRQRFADRTGARVYADWREMLDREDFDIVSVATYTPQHAEITIACAERGVRVVYCEKPIAAFLEEAEQMVSACEKAGTLLVINHNRRFVHGLRRVQRLIAEGGLGTLTSGSLIWGTGRLGNVGTHMIDALRMQTSRDVQAVSGTLDFSGRPDCRGPEFHDPGGWGVLRLEGGLMVTLDAADFATVPPSITIHGTEGTLCASHETVAVEYRDGRRDEWPIANPEGSSMDLATAEIVDWLAEGRPFPYPGQAALGTHEAIIAFHASHVRNAAWVELPLSGPDRQIELQSG